MKQEIRIGLVDYQSGNVRSVTNAVEHAGGEVHVVRAPQDFSGCTHVILPGVGAFGFCAERLRASGLVPSLEQWALRDERPLLGICVGMQLMADVGEEQGRHEGLGWIGGTVRRMEKDASASIRVPHVGWNEVTFTDDFGRFAKGDAPDFYFDHSFAYDAPTNGTALGLCTHGRDFAAIVRRGNIVATQFHPEKSQEAGMRLLRSFFEL